MKQYSASLSGNADAQTAAMNQHDTPEDAQDGGVNTTKGAKLMTLRSRINNDMKSPLYYGNVFSAPTVADYQELYIAHNSLCKDAILLIQLLDRAMEGLECYTYSGDGCVDEGGAARETLADIRKQLGDTND